MSVEYSYPQYNIDLTAETLAKCADLGARLAGEIGVTIRNEKFLEALQGKPGVRIDGAKIYPDEKIVRANIEKYRSKLRAALLKNSGKPAGKEWLMAALQGARSFTQLGNMCVDDLFSGAQFVIDVEMVNYIKELVEAFDPPRDIISLDDETYNSLKEVCLGNDQFISAYDTAAKFRNIMPSSSLLVREKLRSWMDHRKTLQDRAREEALARIKNYQPTFRLPADKQKALDDIYARAEKALKDVKI